MPTNLQDLPLVLAVIIAAGWVLNQNNASFAKQLVALIDAFDKDYAVLLGKYDTLFQIVWEDRQESRARWVERDRQLVMIAQESKEAQLTNANETHKMRSTVNQITTPFQQMYRFVEAIYNAVVPSGRNGTPRHSQDNPDGD